MATKLSIPTQLVYYLVLIVGAVVMLVPLIYMLSTSLKAHAFVLELPPRFIPSQPTLDNYVKALSVNQFGRYFLNSTIVALSSTVINVILSAMLAYAFARWDFPGKQFLFYTLLATMMIPSLVLIIPQFVLASALHLTNSLQGLVVVYSAGTAFNMFLLRGFFEELPQDLFDSATVDGAGPFATFWRIALPLARPALAAVAIFSFLGAWDEFTWAFTAITGDDSLYTLPVALRYFQQQHGTEWGLVFAGSMIAVLPTIIIFIVFQRQFIKGVMSGAIKG
jgi:multiple sugar transport system permease protein